MCYRITSTLLVYLLLTSSCAHVKNKRHTVEGRLCHDLQFVTVDELETPEFHELVIAAIHFWNGYANKRILKYEPGLPTMLKSPPWVIVSTASVEDMADWDSRTRGSTHIHRNGCIKGASILVNDSDYLVSNRQLLIRIIHELGHSIGLDHSLGKNTIMYEKAGDDTVIKPGQDTLSELKKLYGEKQ